MEYPDFDRILKSLGPIMPILHKKLMRVDINTLYPGFSHHHFMIMGELSEGNLPISELARMLVVKKPQMTRLIDQLVEAGFVERQPDAKDRRVINLVLTKKGVDIREKMKIEIEKNIKKKLCSLTPAELTSMADALDTLKNIGMKIK